MLTTLLYSPKDGSHATGNESLVSTWQQQQDAILWLNIDGELTPELQAMLESKFGLHPLALQDASRERHQPKIEPFDSHTFIILRGLSADSDSIDGENILLAMFIGQRFIITRHNKRSVSIENTQAAIASGEFSLAQGTAQLSLKTHLTRLRRNFHYHVALFDTLQSTPSLPFDDSLTHEINDICEQQHRAASLADLFYNVAGDLIDGYISVSAHRLNNIMKVLTIITAIFVPLTFIAGIYGMNFEYIPELKHRFGYFIVWGVMLFLTTVLIGVFRKKKWL